jgi:hypothetical protein
MVSPCPWRFGSRLPRDAVLVPCLSLLVCRIHSLLRSAPDSCGYRLFCRGTAGPGPLGRCPAGVRCLERIDLFGAFGNRWSGFCGWQRTCSTSADRVRDQTTRPVFRKTLVSGRRVRVHQQSEPTASHRWLRQQSLCLHRARPLLPFRRGFRLGARTRPPRTLSSHR